jgi:glycosyltransferase involved in cell wall biosynthesis
MPSVSVVMTAFRERPETLKASIESILNQTMRDIELIVLLDGLPEGVEIAGIHEGHPDGAHLGADPELKKVISEVTDSRLKAFENRENLGLTKSLVKAIKSAEGEFIARQDADDYSEPNRLEKQVEFLRSHSDHVLVATKYKEKRGSIISPQSIPFVKTDKEIREALKSYNPVAHSSAMFRKSTYDLAGGYDESFTRSQDYDLWIRLLDHGKAEILPEELVTREFSNETISTKNNKSQIWHSLRARIKAFERYGVDQKALFHVAKNTLAMALPSPLVKKVRELKSKL